MDINGLNLICFLSKEMGFTAYGLKKLKIIYKFNDDQLIDFLKMFYLKKYN